MRGERTTPSCSSAHVRRTKAAVAHQMFLNGRGSRRQAPLARAVHSLSAPKGQATHHTRPARTNVKMMPAHQIVHVSLVARLTAPSCTSARPIHTTPAVTTSIPSWSPRWKVSEVRSRRSHGIVRRSTVGAVRSRPAPTASAARAARSPRTVHAATPIPGARSTPTGKSTTSGGSNRCAPSAPSTTRTTCSPVRPGVSSSP